MTAHSFPIVHGFIPFDREALESSIPSRFADVAARAPGALAVCVGDESLTYADLDIASRHVANAVAAALGDSAEPVGLLLGQGVALATAILGVLRAGHFYVPLDTTHPEAVLAGVIADCGARLVLTDAARRELATRILAPMTIDVSAPLECGVGHGPKFWPAADDLAYVYYTSGSTGRPKGVAETHRNVLHNVMRYTNAYGFHAGDRLTLLQAPAFSGAVSSLFGALLNGASVHPYDVAREGVREIGSWVQRQGITVYHSVPALFRHVMRAAVGQRNFASVRLVRLEGDLATPQDVKLFRAHCVADAVLAHGLGATECGLIRRFVIPGDTPFAGAIVPIGYAVEDMDVSIEDESGMPAPPGTIGEIVVESRYLSPGYWKRDDLTARAFRPGKAAGSRAYHTGDLGRMRADSCLEHLGRMDQQPKLHGQRIDAEAIVAALVATGLVSEAIVEVRGPTANEGRLVAYVVPAGASRPSASLLRRSLAQTVAPGLIPARFEYLAALPLTAHGKVDRAALPMPDRARPALDGAYLAPTTEREQAVAALWCEALGLDQVGVRDDFFELGGDSLSATLLLERLHESMGIDLPDHALFEAPTIEGLMRELGRSGTRGARAGGETAVRSPLVRVQPQGSRRPFFFLHAEYGGDGFYCLNVARQLGDDQPFYALSPLGRDGGPSPRAIETMAAEYLRHLRAVQPRGPYALGGFCASAVVAWEMATCLRAAGEEIALLLLIEAPVMKRRKLWRWLRTVAGGIAAVRGGGAELRHDLMRVASRRLGRGGALAWRELPLVLRWVWGWPPPEPPGAIGSDPRRRISDVYERAVQGYLPHALDAPVLCLRAMEAAHAAPVDGWRGLSREFDERMIPGDHDSCIIMHARELAAPLRDALSALAR